MKNDAFLGRTLLREIKKLHENATEARAFKWENEFGDEKTTVAAELETRGLKIHSWTFYAEEFSAEVLSENIQRTEKKIIELLDGTLKGEDREAAILRAAFEARMAFEEGWDGSLSLLISAKTARRALREHDTAKEALEFILGCDIQEEAEKSRLEEES